MLGRVINVNNIDEIDDITNNIEIISSQLKDKLLNYVVDDDNINQDINYDKTISVVFALKILVMKV